MRSDKTSIAETRKCGRYQTDCLLNIKKISAMKNQIVSCEFNIDTACVDVKLTDGSMVSIDCDIVEAEYAKNVQEVSKLDYLIYNEPISYVGLLLSGKMEDYLKTSTDYIPLSDLKYY